MIDTQRLRDLADALQGCEWEVPLGSEQLCRDAVDELESARQRISALEAALRAVSTLIDESRGVYGLHLNGDRSPWDELLEGGRYEEWLLDYSVGMKAMEGK